MPLEEQSLLKPRQAWRQLYPVVIIATTACFVYFCWFSVCFYMVNDVRSFCYPNWYSLRPVPHPLLGEVLFAFLQLVKDRISLLQNKDIIMCISIYTVFNQCMLKYSCHFSVLIFQKCVSFIIKVEALIIRF